MYQVGIDMGSSATKTVLMENGELLGSWMQPTGYSTLETSQQIFQMLKEQGISKENARFAATGYGRISIPYADEVITEITCHGKGAYYLFGEDGTVIDVGGQDTKGIQQKKGRVFKFLMNDKCSAGTGKFLEIMTNRLGVSLDELAELASRGNNITISSMCTVFAESEVISLIGSGTSREDIANGVISSVVTKVAQLISGVENEQYFLTGGLCGNEYFRSRLEKKLNRPVKTNSLGRYAGAIGAAISMQ
ncbi:MAG: acyl-CoA dehydratase activase [Lachnospiraceae bacterium]|nr:acyl-CoA dehydratase activase [Lachnospiraceae bacterium]